jgi:hypothetical protein
LFFDVVDLHWFWIVWYFKSCHFIPWRDSISRPITQQA